MSWFTNMACLPDYQPQGIELGIPVSLLMNQELHASIFPHTPAHQQQWNAGPDVSRSNHSLNNFGASPTIYTDPGGFTRLAQQGHYSNAAENNQSTVLPSGVSGVKEVGGR